MNPSTLAVAQPWLFGLRLPVCGCWLFPPLAPQAPRRVWRACSPQRVAPPQPRKATEIAVVGVHHSLVVDRQSGDVRIREQGALQHTGWEPFRKSGQDHAGFPPWGC